MKKLVLYCIVITIILLLGYFLFCPMITFEGNNVLGLNEEYSYDNYYARNVFFELTDKVEVTSNIDNTKVGIYEVKYSLTYLFYNLEVKKEVKVIDKTNPIIELEGGENVNVCPNSDYEEIGYKAVDNYDGDITDKVNVTKNDKEIIYEVVDSNGNYTKTSRIITYADQENPTLTLNGDGYLNIYLGNDYVELGYTAVDNCNGDITDKVIITGTVDKYNVGTYNLDYEVTDESGNKSSITRTINVIPKPSYYGNGKIYLTFDDGPSASITPFVLDILKEEGVKATFFVLDKSSSLDYLIKRAHDEGHTIALHSQTHDYSYIYSSVDNYFADLNAISNKVKNITGSTAMIIRFPGGSSNTISRNYSYKIMSKLTVEVTNLGYKYFDWNVDSNDAGSARTKDDVYYNVINNLSHNKTNIVLMHDFENNYKTLNALRDIIKYGKDNGYTFEAITLDTPQVIHGVNN